MDKKILDCAQSDRALTDDNDIPCHRLRRKIFAERF